MLGKADYVRKLREGVDMQVVQKPPAEVAATADKGGGAFTWVPASGAERVEVGVWRAERVEVGVWRAGRWEQRGGEGWDEVMD